jgi:amylosucrase
VFDYQLHQQIQSLAKKHQLDTAMADQLFFARLTANADAIRTIYQGLYGEHQAGAVHFSHLIETIIRAYAQRSTDLRQSDEAKEAQDGWFLSNEMAGMALYVDRFAGSIDKMGDKLDYLKQLGINLLHLMPIFQSPPNESDGGYAVSDFRAVDPRFGTIADLRALRQQMASAGMYLMLDIVLNHTSYHHEWAKKAKSGDAKYQDYYYMFPDRTIPDQLDRTMPEIFPEAAPGSFTYDEACGKWVMTVFHRYQWDLNYSNPAVLVDMLDTIFFYANLGVDVLRIDAPAFIWKQLGTTCQNLPEAHELLRLIRLCVQAATPGMALLGEAIVAPKEILKYFGTGAFTARECDFAYNATHMAVQWDALATADTRVMLAAQSDILQKPLGTSWITYTRCHDDIGLGYEDGMIAQAGYQPYAHRKYMKEYYSGAFRGSPAKGALFSVNPKTQDARISGSLAALCGLEAAIEAKNAVAIDISIRKVLMMQAHSFFLGGMPMVFYGDEMGYLNDYSYLTDPGKSYDNRWMHRPIIDWKRNQLAKKAGTTEQLIFDGTSQLLTIRKQLPAVADRKNILWMQPHNPHIAGYVRHTPDVQLFCVFNFANFAAPLTWFAFREHGYTPTRLYDHWSGKEYTVGGDHEYLMVEAYRFYLFEAINDVL